MLKIPAIILVSLVAGIVSSPAGRVKLDQTQQGELNVRADLQNIVIVIIPPSRSNPAELLGLLKGNFGHSKTKRRRHHYKPEEPEQPEAEHHESEDPQNFIESKTAPYHVDITQSKINKEKIDPQVKKTDEMLIARTAPGNEKLDDASQKVLNRFARAYVITLPVEKDDENVETLEASASENKEKFLLLGAENEQCGPGSQRDDSGICRVVKII